MTQNTLLRLDHLTLKNFRCFTECSVDLHPTLTVLVAENGQGKTAILDAAGIAIGLFVDTLAATKPLHGFDETDVHLIRERREQDDSMQPAPYAEFTARGFVAGRSAEWSRSRVHGHYSRTSIAEAKQLRQIATDLRASIIREHSEDPATPLTLPLVASYGTGRLWSEHRLSMRRQFPERVSGYMDWHSSSSSFRGLTAWYEDRIRRAGDFYATGKSLDLSLLGAVREATRVVLEPTGWCDLGWDRARRCIVVDHVDHGRLPLSALSDGVRNMVALVADIARRCVSLNPHLSDEAATHTPGLLIVDEIDMHLHPDWQQKVVGLLQQAFPQMQLILSTHSPHVLSTIEFDSIRMIGMEDGHARIRIPEFQTRGVESTEILAEVMGVNAVPPVEQARWLSEYRALVETSNDESPDARALFSKLVEHFGSQHPVMAEVAVLRRLQQFRRANRVPPQPGI